MVVPWESGVLLSLWNLSVNVLVSYIAPAPLPSLIKAGGNPKNAGGGTLECRFPHLAALLESPGDAFA